MICRLLIANLTALLALPALDLPQRPISLGLLFAAGGGTEVVVRVVAKLAG